MNAVPDFVQTISTNASPALLTEINHVPQEATAAAEYATHHQMNVLNVLTLISRLAQVQLTAVINLRPALQENAVILSGLTVL